MFHVQFLLLIITNSVPIIELMEGTSTSNVEWQKQDSTPFNQQFSCENGQLIGPFLGKIEMNIKKTITNLQPHFQLQITLDLLFTEYWSGISNYINVLIDQETIYSDSSINSVNFNTPNNYCKENAFFSFVYNQQLITIRKKIINQNLIPSLEIQSSFQCAQLSPYTVCEKLLVKNIVITPILCHFTCLTCNGPNKNNCLTCPQGMAQNGICKCENGYYSYNYQCIESCPQYYAKQGLECRLNCTLNCQSCQGKQCKICENDYVLYQGSCIINCPKWSYLQNDTCVDYIDQKSEFIGIYFNGLDIDLESQINQFTFTYNSALSKLTGEIFSTYNDTYLLGGFGVWSDGQFNIIYNGLSAHNKIRIYLTAWFIDNWTNEHFIIKLDNQIIYDITYESQKATNNLFYLSYNDYIEEIYLNVVHTSSSAELNFLTTLSVSAYQASLALSNIYILIDYCDNYCEICQNTQCFKCQNPYQLINNQCALCDSTNFRNNDCTCQIGYYDNNINYQCQKCRQECETCIDNNICTQCKLETNLIILPNCMNCNTGFYYNDGICSKCDSTCLSCFGSEQSQCLSCYNGYILGINNQCETCMSNQFIYNNICQNCKYNCETCIDSQNCLTCTQERINAPFCICQLGYYENTNKECQPCNIQCSTCESQSDNCLSCSGNRLNPPFCKCHDESDSNDTNVWCTDCSIVNLHVRMSTNVKKLILQFRKQIQKVNSQCEGLFEESTLNSLGINSSCFVNQYSIEVLLGQNATIYFGFYINFKPNVIKLLECEKSVTQFLNNILYDTQDLETPLIIFTKNLIQLSTCSSSPDIIQQIFTNNFGNNQITFLEWKLIRVFQKDPKINELIDILTGQFQNYNQTFKFEFPNDILKKENEILLQLKYQNFLGIQGSSLITIKQLKSKLNLNIQSQKSQYLNSQLIQIVIQVTNCQQLSKNDLKLNISTRIGTLQKQVEVHLNEYYIYSIEPYILNAGLYQLYVGVYNQEILELEDIIQILIVNEEPLLQLLTESNYLGFSQQLVIQGIVKNIDIQNPLLKWDCFDITKNSVCLTLNQKMLILNDSQNLTIQPYTLNPYSVYKFTATFLDLQQFVIISIIESNVPKIGFESYPDISDGYINYYDQLLFKFKFLEIVQNPDQLIYTGILSNSDLVIKHFRFNYLELQISLWHYFTIEELTKQIILKINIQSPDFFSPSQITIPLNINIPPLQCRIEIGQLNQTNISNYSIIINNCQDVNFPLQYRLVLYFNSSDLSFDYSINKIQKGIILFDYQYSQIFETQLTGNGNIYLMVQVKDNLNGKSNYTKSLNVTYVQGNLRKILLNSVSISETLIYVASLQFEQNQNTLEISQTLQKQIKYFSSCQCITQKQLLTLKTLTKNYMNLQQSDIQKELSLQKERLNSIKQILGNQQFNQQYKYEHTIQEFNKLILLEETIEIAKYISELYELNKQNQQQARLLISDFDYQKNNNNHIIIDSINLITEIQLKNQVINGRLQNIVTNQFNISTQKTSQKVLDYLISDSLTKPQVIGQDEQQNDNKQSELETYSFKMIKYRTNPYIYDSYFTNNYVEQQYDYPLYQPEIKQLSNQNLLQNIVTSQSIRYNFENQDENLIVECVAKVKDNWSVDSCQTIKEGKKTTCQCQYISSTTILEATQKIFDEAVDFFSLKTIQRMLRCSYQSIIFTYIIMIYTILFLWFILYGYKMDKSNNEDTLFHSTKVTPSDWDLATEKQGRIIIPGDVESLKQLPTIDGIRGENTKKTIFNNNESQITSDDKQLKRPNLDYYNKILANRKSIAITTNICSERIMEENEPQLSPKSRIPNSPSIKIVTSQLSTPRGQDINGQESLYEKYSSQKVTLGKAILFYIEINHKVLSLYYLYDKDCSRVYRTIILYVALLGEISILTFFGKIINFNSIVALSILQTLFGIIYRKLLQVFLKSEKQCINYIGFNLVILSVLFFLFMIFGSVAKYQSVLEASLWGVAYISSFILDYLVYTNFQILVIFSIIVNFGNSQTVKKYLKMFLNDKVFMQTFGNS